jgi:PTS HPr component phosphorylation site
VAKRSNINLLLHFSTMEAQQMPKAY